MRIEKQHWDKMADQGRYNVIDPTDKKGFKNNYIKYIKDRAVKNNLPTHKTQILDFGCGSGNLPRSIACEQYKMIGMDISHQQLKLAFEDNDADHTLFIQYNGEQFPFKDRSIECVTAIGMFNFILEDQQLLQNLGEINRVLSDQGKLICTIHTRKQKKYYDQQKKNIKTEEEFIHMFHETGFTVEKKEYIRKSHHPLIYLIKWGLIPSSMYESFANIDQKLASLFHKPLLGYVDTLLVLKKKGGRS